MPNTGPTAWNFPDFFVGKSQALSAYEPYPVLTGSQFSSVPPASAPVVHWNQPAPIVLKNLVVQNSLSVSVPGATSQASTGSEAFSYALSAFLYSYQDYSSSITNLFPVRSGSFGLSGTMGYSSTSQQFGMSWVTDSAGGTSAFTTTSSDGAWSNFASGPKMVSIPFNTTLPSGEYFMAFQHSSTAATSNSAVTLLSMSQLQIVGQQASVTAGALGASVTTNSIFFDAGVINATPIFSTTMAASSVTIAARPIWFAMSNA